MEKSKCQCSTEDLDTPVEMTRGYSTRTPPVRKELCVGSVPMTLPEPLPPQPRGSNINCPQAPVGDNRSGNWLMRHREC